MPTSSRHAGVWPFRRRWIVIAALIVALPAVALWWLHNVYWVFPLMFPPETVLLDITDLKIAQLKELRAQPKYVNEPGTIYNGLRPETDRLVAERQLNDLIDKLAHDLPAKSTNAFVLGQFAKTLAQFEPTDSEDRDRLCAYLEQIMDIVGIESSGGLLNRWRYGFDPTPASH